MPKLAGYHCASHMIAGNASRPSLIDSWALATSVCSAVSPRTTVERAYVRVRVRDYPADGKFTIAKLSGISLVRDSDFGNLPCRNIPLR